MAAAGVRRRSAARRHHLARVHQVERVEGLLEHTHQLVALAVLASWVTASFQLKWRLPPDLKTLTLTDARNATAPILWIDVRDSDRFESDHVPDAISFEEHNRDDSLAKIIPRWTPNTRIIVYGEGPGSDRASRVAKNLKKDLGTREVYLLEGGWAVWPRN